MCKKPTQEEFCIKLKKVKPHLEVLSNYEGSESKITVRCSKDGHIWDSTPHRLLKHDKNDCPVCYNNRRGEKLRLGLDVFIERAMGVHGDRYDYSKSIYTTNLTKLIVICPEHGDFEIKPNSHIEAKQGCPICLFESKRESIEKQLQIEADRERRRIYAQENKEKNREISKEKRKEYVKKYNEKNAERIKQKSKERYEKNIEHNHERSKNYYQENKARLNEKNKKYRLENPEKFREYTKKHREKNIDKIKAKPKTEEQRLKQNSHPNIS